jgi:hypothetical protein
MLGIGKRIAMIVLSLWLILTGLFAVADVGFPGSGLILNLLAIVAGVLILAQGQSWSAKVGMVLLGVWLVVQGLLAVMDVGLRSVGLVVNLLPIAAGALILLED